MNPNIAELIEICELDRSLYEIRAQLEKYPQLLAGLDEADAKLAGALASARSGLAAATESRRKAELEVRDLRARVAKFEGQQSQVKTNKEMSAIIEEIRLVREHIDEHDTAGLEALEAEETISADIARLEGEAEALASENKAERERIAIQIDEKEENREGRAEEREVRFNRLPLELREMYELIDERFPGTAVVPVRDGFCGGCNMSLVAKKTSEVRSSEGQARCENCSRILYFAD